MPRSTRPSTKAATSCVWTRRATTPRRAACASNWGDLPDLLKNGTCRLRRVPFCCKSGMSPLNRDGHSPSLRHSNLHHLVAVTDTCLTARRTEQLCLHQLAVAPADIHFESPARAEPADRPGRP